MTEEPLEWKLNSEGHIGLPETNHYTVYYHYGLQRRNLNNQDCDDIMMIFYLVILKLVRDIKRNKDR